MAILKTPRFWSASQIGRASPAAVRAGVSSGGPAEGLEAFGSEAEPLAAVGKPTSSAAAPASRGSDRALPAAKWIAVVVLTAALAVAAVFGYQRRLVRPATSGLVTIETTPAGLEVVVAGKSLGKTPLTTTLAAGAYDVQVKSAARTRTLKVNVVGGTSLVQHVEFAPEMGGAVVTTGGLRVQTEPARLQVLVDGTPRGLSPLVIDGLDPGEHEVSVRTGAGLVRRRVSIQPRETLSLLVSSAAPAPNPSAVSAGWMSVSSAIPLQLREGGKLIGTTESDRLMLAAGDHEIEFVNAELGFTTKKTVRVVAGKTAATMVALPNGVISVNAQPWAEVWIDGERIGETPLGNLSRPIGKHEVVFRHPEFGERRESVVVTAGKPTRIGVDLRKK